MPEESPTQTVQTGSLSLELGTVDQAHVLYVIFHGAIAFYDDPALPWVDAFICDRKDHHSYLCGKFLGETRIPRGSELALSGVIPGRAGFATIGIDKYLHFKGTRAKPGARVLLDDVYSRLRFPRPSAIFVPRRGVNITDKSDQDGNSLRDTVIGVVTVFQYAFGKASDLALDMYVNCSESCAPGDEGQPDTFPGWKPLDSDPRPMSLHIRAEEEVAPAHVPEDFKAVSGIIGDNDPNKDGSDWKPHAGSPLPGFSQSRFNWEITLSLANRIAWFGDRLAKAIYSNDPVPGVFFPVQAPSDLAFTDIDANCGQQSAGRAGGH